MRILLSAFACSPDQGSEPGVGWCWARELSKKHDVVVLTHEHFRSAIERQMALAPGRYARFIYYQPRWLPPGGPRSLNSRSYYLCWQLGGVFLARRLHKEQPFDLVHHLTWGTFRFPSFMGYLGVPFFFGPAGGGERAPWSLTKALPFKYRLREIVRDLFVISGRYDPLVWISLLNARRIFTKTEETLRALPFWLRGKAIVRHEIGTFPVRATAAAARIETARQFKVLFASNLIGMKGPHLAIEAFAQSLGKAPGAELYIAGKGDLRVELEHLCQRLRIADKVTFLGYLPRAELMALYATMDCFLFPSLHDSSGNVVLEAIAHGLPVICLNLGGAPQFIDASCGRVIAARGQDRPSVVAGLAAALTQLYDTPTLCESLARGALARARSLSWEAQVDRAYSEIERALLPG